MKARILSATLAMLLTGCYTGNPSTSTSGSFSSVPNISEESSTTTPDIPLEPLAIVTYKGQLFFNGKQVTGSVDCEGMALDQDGYFNFTAINGQATVRCSFGVISDLVTFKYKAASNDNWEQAHDTVQTFNFDRNSDLGKHLKDAYTLLNAINHCTDDQNKLCLKLWDSYDIEPLYRSGNSRAIKSFVETVALKKQESQQTEAADV